MNWWIDETPPFPGDVEPEPNTWAPPGLQTGTFVVSSIDGSIMTWNGDPSNQPFGVVINGTHNSSGAVDIMVSGTLANGIRI